MSIKGTALKTSRQCPIPLVYSLAPTSHSPQLVGTQAQGALTIPDTRTIGSLNVHSSKYLASSTETKTGCYVDIETTSLTVPTAEAPETTSPAVHPFMKDSPGNGVSSRKSCRSLPVCRVQRPWRTCRGRYRNALSDTNASPLNSKYCPVPDGTIQRAQVRPLTNRR